MKQLSLLLIFSVFVLQAQELKQFSLDEAIAYAKQNSLDKKNAKLDVDAANARVGELTAVGLPKITGSVNVQHWLKLPISVFPAEFNPISKRYTDVNGENFLATQLVQVNDTTFAPVFGDAQEVEFGTKNNITPAVELNQLLFSGSYLYGLQAARKFVEVTQMQRELVDVDLTENVIQTYLGCLIAKENLVILDRNIDNLSKLQFELSELHKNGFLEEIEVDRVTLTLNNLKSRKNNIEKNLAIAKELLKVVIGYHKEGEIELTTSLQDIMDEEIGMADAKDIYKNRKQYKVLSLQEELNAIDVKRLKSQYYPSLSLYATHQWQYQADNFRLFRNKWFPATTVGLFLNIPIFDGLETKYLIQQRRINKDKISLAKTNLEFYYRTEFMQAQTNYINALDAVETQQKSIELAEKIYNTSIIKYNEGLGSSLEVTTAESQLFETQSLLIQAMYDLVSAKTSLEKSMGKF